MARAVRTHADDNVAVALEAAKPGDVLSDGTFNVVAIERVPSGYKVALQDIERAASIRRYGHTIAVATRTIPSGALVHTHNASGSRERPGPEVRPTDREFRPTSTRRLEFFGFRRADGRVGTRNELWLVCLVGSVEELARRVAAELNERENGEDHGVWVVPALDSSPRPDPSFDAFLGALVSHPNCGAALLIGLRSADFSRLSPSRTENGRLRQIGLQDEPDDYHTVLGAAQEMHSLIVRDNRSRQEIGKLIVGLKCGATDGLSGLTANPLLGHIADIVVASHGATLLTELPELMEAADHFRARASTVATSTRLDLILEDYRKQFAYEGAVVPGEPNPGNIEGGLTTLAEKALGAAQKSGSSPLVGVLRYGEPAVSSGFQIVEAPGTDELSTSALVAAGANIVLFSTGKGTPMGSFAPVVKISSTQRLASEKPDWIDFDGEPMIETAQQLSCVNALLDLVLDVASGRQPKSHSNRQMAFWRRSAVL
ncbi:altronate dehydratase [Exilibacterium tricleocarpae]|uniref:Altronate dehydratase n=1 Tax=Exilibacterium tricleocarpae TaxID=2591008 RepID=A0A545TLG0_9GAMM|nr:UxaA family hydrolase [Exilibacterium tricleocarpae]TQV78065.1 altronate dehydratase [Exilibacterium tricleocarpae]